ncbi:MAG: hypothetical protein HIU81_08025 [Acidobacteria bacterium]|nr:hypothetical protein [Acidobacteriota bacterium]
MDIQWEPYACAMRWDDLFDDLASQFDADAAAAQDAEVDELFRMESAAVHLMDRLRGSLGQEVALRLRSGSKASGTLQRCGDDWILLATRAQRELVPVWSINGVEVQGRSAVQATGATGLTLMSALRALARDRAELVIYLLGGAEGEQLTGVIDTVGRDFCELALVPLGERRRADSVRGRLLVPLRALVRVTSPVALA